MLLCPNDESEVIALRARHLPRPAKAPAYSSMDAFPTPATLPQQIQVTTHISKLTRQHRYPTFHIIKLTTHSSKPATVSKNLSTMSLPQKRSGEVDRTNKPSKKQNRGPVTSDSEDSSAMEELPSQGRDLSLSPALNQSRRMYRNIFTSYGSTSPDAANFSLMRSPSPSRLWPPPAEPLLDRLDRLEQGQNRLRAGLDALQPIVASNVVNKTVTSKLHERVQALEAKSSSKEPLLIENEQLHRNIAILEQNLANQATTLRNIQQSNTELYHQLCEANAKIAFLEGGRV